MNLKDHLICLNDTAEYLGVSTATIQNWIRHEYLTVMQRIKRVAYFNFQQVHELKEKINNGQINRLNKRANKAQANHYFIPNEYLTHHRSYRPLNQIIDYLIQQKIGINTALFLLSCKLLTQLKLIPVHPLSELFTPQIAEAAPFFYQELLNWPDLDDDALTPQVLNTIDLLIIPDELDILGIIYQSLLQVGKKSQSGSYYTPAKIVSGIIQDYGQNEMKVLDPCCGSGQFLLKFSQIVQKPNFIYGFDIDPVAVKLARINLMIYFNKFKFEPAIFHENFLFAPLEKYQHFFDLVITNPPWGMHFNSEEKTQLKTIYPEIKSYESFTYFIKNSLDLLKDEGILSFILPESILSVNVHADIRSYILKHTRILKIMMLGKVFDRVFSPVIRLDLMKQQCKKNRFPVFLKKQDYTICQSRFHANKKTIFDININEQDEAIIDKIYSVNHVTLAHHADWALGIVTGNNAKFIRQEKDAEAEPIYTGKDVDHFFLKETNNFIRFQPEHFQQTADPQKYRSNEKLIYRFISKNLIFAYDDQKSLTLNSANILIPQAGFYPVKIILALFNSNLYQYLFQKKFNAIKILKSHLEELPLPRWSPVIMNSIIDSVDRILKNRQIAPELDQKIFQYYQLTPIEIQHILSNIK